MKYMLHLQTHRLTEKAPEFQRGSWKSKEVGLRQAPLKGESLVFPQIP